MSNNLLSGHYDLRLVALSLFIAVLASYCALHLAERTWDATGRIKLFWIIGGASAMGLGIWAMHYIGMLAFSLPIPIFYNVPIVIFSLLAAIGSSAMALTAVSRKSLRLSSWIGGSLLMGLGISSMHYSGMAAMRISAHCFYNPRLVAASIFIAFVVSLVALKIAFTLRTREASKQIAPRLVAATVMGLAIASMHYTGMAAMGFRPVAGPINLNYSVGVSEVGIAGIVLVTLMVLALTLIGTITDRHFSLQRDMLHSEQQRWAMVQRANQDSLFDVDLIRGSVFDSDRWSEIVGFPPGRLPMTSAAWMERIHIEDRELVRESLDEYLARESDKFLLEYRLQHSDGAWRWLLVQAQGIWDSSGKAIRLVGSHSDVTRRREDEIRARIELEAYNDRLEQLVEERTTELKTSEKRWRSLVEAIPQFVWSTHPNGYCDYLSQQWIEYTGVPLSEQLGSGWLNALHPDDRELAGMAWKRATSLKEHFDVEYRLRAQDGSYRWFRARGVAVLASNGNVQSWVGTTSDIETQKRSSETLEAAVRTRTEELGVALAQANLAAQAKSEFLAAMSHEIRTPMNGVIGMTNLLLETPLTSEQRLFVDTVRSSGEALLTIIDGVLDFSKIEAGKLVLEDCPFDLESLVEESIEVLSRTAESKKLRLSFDISQTVPLDLVGDAGRLRQVLLNLLSNAVKFTEVGSVRLSISLEARQRELAVCALP